MTIFAPTQSRRRLSVVVASLGLALVSACDDSRSNEQGKGEDKAVAPASTSPPDAEGSEPGGLGLEQGQLWRLELDGEAPFKGQYGGELLHALRKGDDLSLSFEGEGVELNITLEHVPMGQTGRYSATPARFHASTPDIECGTARGGSVKVNLTHNAVDRVAGRIEGDIGCKQADSAKVRCSGAFDYSGDIDFK